VFTFGCEESLKGSALNFFSHPDTVIDDADNYVSGRAFGCDADQSFLLARNLRLLNNRICSVQNQVDEDLSEFGRDAFRSCGFFSEVSFNPYRHAFSQCGVLPIENE
jgi:hypothetical protein